MKRAVRDRVAGAKGERMGGVGLVREIADSMFDAALIASDNSEEAAVIALRIAADWLEESAGDIAADRLRGQVDQAITSGS